VAARDAAFHRSSALTMGANPHVLAPMPVLIDTDPGVDDALALAFALRSGLFDVKAITVVAGNCPVDQGVENTFRVLEAVRDSGNGTPPVYRGAEKPLSLEHTGAEHVHGQDGLGGISELLENGQPRYPKPEINLEPDHAVDGLLYRLRKNPGEITIITLGPLTNLALAALKDPIGLAMAWQIVCMAGAFRVPGNVTPVAEYNVWADPDACRELLALYSQWQADATDAVYPRLRFVGLDVTHQVILDHHDLERWIEPSDSFSRFLLDCTDSTFRFHLAARGFEGMYLHDPLAVLLAARPDLGETERLSVQVECEGQVTLGMTVADRRGWDRSEGVPVDVYTQVNAHEALQVFRQGLFGGE
jgi:purine nucleosidase